MRTFVGLSLPDAHRETLAAHLAECARLAPAYRWVEPDALHLTLRFIGQVEPGVLDEVRHGLAAIRAAPFRLALGERGTFGPRRSPRVVWLGVGEGLDACTALAAGVEEACQAAGLEADPRGFRAHVTLARARSEVDRLGELPEPPPLTPWTVEDFVLFESRLGQRPRYVPVERYWLADAR
jgi:2'-5' RNA ligase